MNKKGLSLVEIMVVLAIVGIFVTFGARKLINNSTQMKSSVRQFAVMVKKLRTRARVRNKTYRIVFDLPEDKNKEQSYWVESTEKKALLLTAEEREEITKEQDDEKDKKPKDPQGFTVDTSLIREAPATLPRGLFFDSVELAGQDRSFKSGRVFIYFFPQGYVQESAIHLTDRNDLHWTLAVQPLTGRVDIFNSHRSLEDLKEE